MDADELAHLETIEAEEHEQMYRFAEGFGR